MVQVVYLVIAVLSVSLETLSSSIQKSPKVDGNRENGDTPSHHAESGAGTPNKTIEEHPWIVAKPSKDKLNSSCFMLKSYDKLWPKECRYVMNKNNKYTVNCKSFCEDWIENLKKTYNLPNDCKYDDENSTPYCKERLKPGCTPCKERMGNFYSKCCGSCARKGCTKAEPPH